MGNVNMEAKDVHYRGGNKPMSVEEAIKAAGTEITPEEKTWIDSIPVLTTSNAGKTDQDVIAPEFDAEAGVYAVGDKVMYEGKLYEFTSAHETPGDWDSTEVSETTVADDLNSLESGLSNYEIQNGINLEVVNRKNVLPSTLTIIKAANTNGTWSGNVYSYNGVDFTVNTNASGYVLSITAANAATTESSSALYIPMPKDNNKYLFNGGADTDHNIIVWDATTSARAKKWDSTTNIDDSTGSTLLEVSNVSDHNLTVRCRVSSGVASGSKTFYPMVCPSTTTDTTFAPYIPSVEARLAALEAAVFNS